MDQICYAFHLREGMVVEKRSQSSYPEISTPESTGQLQEREKGEAVLDIGGRTSSVSSSQGNSEK